MFCKGAMHSETTLSAFSEGGAAFAAAALHHFPTWAVIQTADLGPVKFCRSHVNTLLNTEAESLHMSTNFSNCNHVKTRVILYTTRLKHQHCHTSCLPRSQIHKLNHSHKAMLTQVIAMSRCKTLQYTATLDILIDIFKLLVQWSWLAPRP